MHQDGCRLIMGRFRKPFSGLTKVRERISFDLKAGAGWIIGNGTRAVLSELEMCTWSMVVSGSRSTSLEEEEELGDGIEGSAKAIPLRVVVTLISSLGLGMVLLGSAP
ncbi:hypothetical protein Tco_1307547 [Tanacetum coccineum]